MPAPVFTPEQEAEIRRMIAVSRLAGELAGDIVESPTPTEEEKGDLERAIDELKSCGYHAATGVLARLLPGRDLARAREAESKLAKVAASRRTWRALAEDAYNQVNRGWANDYRAALASDKEDGL